MDMNEQFLRRGTKNEKKNCQSKLRHFEYDTQTFNNFWIMFEMHSRDIVQKKINSTLHNLILYHDHLP